MVPEGWTKAELGDTVQMSSGGTPSKLRPDFWGGSFPWVSAKDLKTHYLCDAEDHLTESGMRAAKIAEPGSVLVLVRGMTLLKDVPIAYATAPLAFNQDIKALRATNGTDPLFLSFALAGRKTALMRLVDKANHGTGRLDTDLLSELPVYLPPLPEQRKIAEILSTWDKAIETTEKQLANAETQKRALIQQLLTGKRRLKGFVAAWEKCHLEDVTQIIVSNVDKKSAQGERPVRLCNYMDVYSNDTVGPSLPLMQATATAAQIAKFGLQVGDVLITKDSETPDDIAVPAYVSATADDLVCGYHLAIIRPRANVLGRFLKFYFEHPHTRYYFASRANGATRFGLTIASIEEAPINLPSIEEQERIADAIAAAEVEVKQAVEAIECFRSEKRALMQQLLTGKRRVKV